MSIKTIYKRIALVVVATLGAGVLSVAPASAADAYTSAATTGTHYATVGTPITTTVTIAGDGGSVLTGGTVTATMTAAPTGSTAAASWSSTGIEAPFAAGGNANNSHPVTYATNVATIAADPDGTGVGHTTAKIMGTLSFTPAVAGTYTITLTLDAAFGAGNEVNGTITVYAAGLAYSLGDGAAVTPATSGNGIAGPANTVTVNATTNASGTRALVTVSGAGATINSNAGSAVAAGVTSTIVAAGTNAAIIINTPQAGTVTVSQFYESGNGTGIFAATASKTATITVRAAGITGLLSTSTVYMNTSTTDPTASSDATTTTTAPLAASTASNTPMANIKVTQLDGQVPPVAVPNTATKAVVYEISGAGALGTANNVRLGSYIAVAAGTAAANIANDNIVYIYPDGRTGVGTITVKVNGVLVATKTVKFHGAVASYTLVTKNAVLAVGSTSDTQVLTVQALDANGVAIPSHTVYVSSGTTTVATVDAASVTTSSAGVAADIGVNGVAKGSAVITVGNAAGTAATVSATATISVVAACVSSVALSFDKTSYLPGEKATLSITLKNADAALVGDQEYANLFATGGITASANLTTVMTAIAATTVSGVKTFTVYMPLAEGPVSVEGTLGTSVVTALQATKVSASTTVAKPVVPVVVPPVVYDNPTLSFVKSKGRIILSGTAVNGEGDIIIYVKKVGTTAWKERAKTLEVAAPGDFNGSIKAPKANVLMRVKQEGTGQFSNQIIVVK